MPDVMVWTGPVFDQQVPGAWPPGAKQVWYNCRGDKGPHPWCPGIGEQLRHNPGMLWSKAGVSEADVGDLYFAGFSAGGSIIKRLLEEQPWRDRTTAVHLADATWTSGVLPPPAIEGFVRYGIDVATGPGDKLFIATASPIPNKQWATAHANLDAIRKEIEARTGLTFQQRGDFFGVTGGGTPEEVWQLGNVIFANMPLEPVGHGHTKFAPEVWDKVIQPWIDKGKGPIDAPGPVAPPPVVEPPVPPVPVVAKPFDAKDWGYFALGAGIGLGLTWWLGKGA